MPGEFRTIQTPCYRCRRLGVPCVIRQTILGRPSPKNRPSAATIWLHTETEPRNVISPIFIELSPEASEPDDVQEERIPSSNSIVPLSKRWCTNDSRLDQSHPARWYGGQLLVHTPQSPETAFTIRAIDTLRYEGVEREWFRHLPAYAGHSHALDLSIKALVAACAYKRGTPRITPGDCYQALALALSAVKTSIVQSYGEPDDSMLASTALLARFDGEIQKNYIPTRLHVEGLATILAARSSTYQVTPIARDILDFHAGESAIMACIQGTASPFEKVDRAYFANSKMRCSKGDRTQLKALGNEMFIGLPRLVGLVRSIRLEPFVENTLHSDALRLLRPLLELQDSQAEERLLQDAKTCPSDETDTASPLGLSLHFASYKDFEALTYYWQSRLSLLRLELRLYRLSVSSCAHAKITEASEILVGPRLDEMVQLAKNILMCAEYASTLRLNKHIRLFAHALVVVWGVTMDIPGPFGHDQDGKGSDFLADWLLCRVNVHRHEKLHLTAEDMNIAADIFVGGPPKGRFAERFGL
ncbi:uncharacterized protein CC84DRAFT_1190299 [Paraphaeosphaeria sporulosa]|uniref:Zn(2)-C6 fungal-type domain-containing protein n=1 Tax=Paraphaeosphaeria sporulosa TaxID=1460663 RepID=A0A177C029_9PLEO|nr:uncharacterized protein CC84DRAFT_1190299 [Paraphaeosphaeria sporulosa]OAG01144.1 hypothetical protein CC84DRAFT_1190299 [Paraphaeosphaeria sporulosa]